MTIARRLTPWLLPAAILVGWEIASRTGALSARILPEPAAVFQLPVGVQASSLLGVPPRVETKRRAALPVGPTAAS